VAIPSRLLPRRRYPASTPEHPLPKWPGTSWLEYRRQASRWAEGDFEWVRHGSRLPRDDEKHIVHQLVRQRCLWNEEFIDADHWWWRWFYTIKALICYLLHRDLGTLVAKSRKPWRDGPLQLVDRIACWDVEILGGAKDTEIFEWSNFAVGYGVWTQWWYLIEREKSARLPEMKEQHGRA